MTITSRQYRNDGDLCRMQALLLETWRREKPYVDHHIGDLDWWMYQHTGPDPTELIHLWFDGRSELVGWAWFSPPATLDFHVRPDYRDGILIEQMLGWLASCARADASELSVWALEHDGASVAALRRHGYRKTDECFVHALRRLKDEIPAPTLPEGFMVRHVRGEDDLVARVAVHRAAFAPSRVTLESYRNVMRSSTYRPELDMVVVAPDGTLAAFCLCWLDEENAVGELEPVGAHPDYRRMGCAWAACVAALRQLKNLGGDTAIVYHTGRDERAARLYESLGFREITKLCRFRAPFSPGS